MEIIYRAFDGKIFNDEDDCLRYEREQNFQKVADQVVFIGLDGERLDFKEVGYNLFDIVDCMFFETDECAKFISEMAYEVNGYIEWPVKKGFYYWDESVNKFCDMDEKIQSLEEEKERLLAIQWKMQWGK